MKLCKGGMNMLIIDIWADFVCPFSYIGKRNLTHALENLGVEQVYIRYHSYLLYPFAKPNSQESMQQYLSNKYGISEEEAQTMMEDVAELAKGAGVHFQLDTLRPTNTMTAHRLSKLALRHNVQYEFYRTLLRAFFVEQQALDEKNTLRQLAHDVGLPEQEVQKVLANSALFEDAVEEDFFAAQRLGIKGIPYYVLNNVEYIEGTKTVEQFERYLAKVL